jgi:hypothetical protein
MKNTNTYEWSIKQAEMEKAYNEYIQLRNDDVEFAEEWGDSKHDFLEWYHDLYLPFLTI